MPSKIKLGFYSRKYGRVFKSYDKFKKYDKYQKVKWSQKQYEKHYTYKGRMYAPRSHIRTFKENPRYQAYKRNKGML